MYVITITVLLPSGQPITIQVRPTIDTVGTLKKKIAQVVYPIKHNFELYLRGTKLSDSMLLQDYDIDDGDRVGLQYQDPALSDKEFEDVVKNTQLSQPQEMQVEGLQEFSVVYSLYRLDGDRYILGGYPGIGDGIIEGGKITVQKRIDMGRYNLGRG